MRTRNPFALVFCLLLGAGTVHASVVYGPFDVSIETPPTAPAFGQPLEGVLLLSAARTEEIIDIQLVGDGWTVQSFEVPDAASISAGDTWRLPFTATPLTDSRPLELRVETRRGIERLRVGLAPQELRSFQVERPLTSTPVAPIPTATWTTPELARRMGLLRQEPDSGTAAPRGTPRTIRVHGALVYDRTDGERLGAYGVYIQVYDLDTIGKQFLGESFVDVDGRFDFEVVYNETVLDPHPDLEIRFSAENGTAFVRPSGALQSPYSWSQGPWTNFQGTDLDLGTLIPLAEVDHEALHILNSIQRAHRIFMDDFQPALPQVGVVFPHDVWPHYNPLFQQIHIPRDFDDDLADPANDLIDFQWRERMHIHEYGHHLMRERASTGPFTYCNGICDNPDCGHCVWCEESENVAWSEGWPNWFSNHCTNQFPTLAGDTAYSSYDFEPSPHCLDRFGIPLCDCDAWMTEGYFASFLHDLVDLVDLDGSDPRLPGTTEGADELSKGAGVVYLSSFGTGVETPRAFFDELLARYPGESSEIWATARLDGYELDTEQPGTVSNLTSPTHPIGTPSQEAVVQFTWTAAPDDISGIGEYLIGWSTDPNPGIANSYPGDMTSWSSPPSAPGDWYVRITAVDRTGNHSTERVIYGPVTILQPDPANLLYAQPAGWYSSLVPRLAPDATASLVPAPTILRPANNTYWANLAVTNDGQLTAAQLDVRLYLDDLTTTSVSAIAVGAGIQVTWLNRGPLMAPSGRHTLWAELDPNHLIPEIDETDNLYGLPWVWEPAAMGLNDAVQSPRPGLATAGWESLPGPIVLTLYNADGYRMTSYNGFHAATLRALDNTVDYDLRLYAPASSATSGFITYNAWSTEPAGQLDVVISNSGAGGVRDYDLGVLNLAGASANYEVRTYGGGAAAIGDSVTVPVALDDHLLLRQFWVSSADTGSISVSISADPSGGPWNLSVFDPATVHTELATAPWTISPGATSYARLTLHAGQIGMYGLVVHRDPIHGAPATSVTLEIERTPPDLQPNLPATWYASIVPRATGGSFTTLPAPTSLPSDQPVFVYGANKNSGPNSAAATTTIVEVDGVTRMSVPAVALPPFATSTSQFGTMTVGGGRHTIGMSLDAPGTVKELDELNNRVAEQYVFAPMELGNEPYVATSAPPDRSGGLAQVPPGRPKFYNCDGFGLPAPVDLGATIGWILCAAMPEQDQDVDLRLHPGWRSGIEGFDDVLVQSTWGRDLSEFALAFSDSMPDGQIDAGVVATDASGGYTIQASGDEFLDYRGSFPEQFYGDLTLVSEQTATLYALEMRAGSYFASVEPVAAKTDLGLSAFTPGTSFALAKSDAADGATSWQASPGEVESVGFDLESDGIVLLVVWKVGSADLEKESVFGLRIGRVSETDAPAGQALPTRRVTIAEARPNPFNPRLEIRYATPTDGPVTLEVFDIRGQRVSTLVSRVLGAGIHHIEWAGTDDSGRAVSSGVYVLRLQAPGGIDTHKVALVR